MVDAAAACDAWDRVGKADLMLMQLQGSGTSRILHLPDKTLLVTVYTADRPHVARVVVADRHNNNILDRRRFRSLGEAAHFLNGLLRP